jgi:Mg2+-importing ATPase
MLVLRTRRPAWRSRPAGPLLLSSALVALITLAVPYSPLAPDVGLDRPTPAVLAALAAITAAYVVTTELAKHLTGRASTSH